MPESPADFPTLSILGTKTPRADREKWTAALTTQTNVNTLNRAARIIQPADLSPSPDQAVLRSVEQFAIDPALLPAEIQKAIPAMVGYFSHLAVEEGLTDSGIVPEIEILFIPRDDYNLAFPKTLAVFSTATKKVYVSHGRDQSPKAILSELASLGHELRHRIARLHADILLRKDESTGQVTSYEYSSWMQLNKLHPRNWNEKDRYFFEELFTNGWVVDHLREIIPAEVIESYVADHAQRKTIDRSAATLETALETDGILQGVEHDLYYIWQGYKEFIPNFEELLIQARSGKPNSVVPLVQAIITAFGKEGLLALTYTKLSNFRENMDLYSALFTKRAVENQVHALRTLVDEHNETFWGKVENSMFKKIASKVSRRESVSGKLRTQLNEKEAILHDCDQKVKQSLTKLLKNNGYKGVEYD
ncbi:hypothetical protein KBD71_02885 [Candidatus Woesebacteria bacterium]|nr:hypothetical protein [Candidatus Woesebacteria bacterium]